MGCYPTRVGHFLFRKNLVGSLQNMYNHTYRVKNRNRQGYIELTTNWSRLKMMFNIWNLDQRLSEKYLGFIPEGFASPQHRRFIYSFFFQISK